MTTMQHPRSVLKSDMSFGLMEEVAMKKKYEQPEMNVENFKVEDAIMRARVVEPNPCEEDCTQDTSTAYNPD